MSSLSDDLTSWMSREHLGVDDIVDRVKVRRATVDAWMGGKNPTPKHCSELRRMLGVSDARVLEWLDISIRRTVISTRGLLADDLQAAMDRQGLSRVELAAAIGTPCRSVDGWMTGHLPRMEAQRAIADYLGFGLDRMQQWRSADMRGQTQFALDLQSWLDRTGTTGVEFALSVGVEKSHASRWLRRVVPTDEQLVRIADAMGEPRSIILDWQRPED